MSINAAEWIGRSETAEDFVARGPFDRLAAMLDREHENAVPPLGHYLCFAPGAAQAEMGEDGEYSLFDQVSDGFDLEAACADNELMGNLGEALEKLPPLQRTLITLYHLDELGIGEIAAITELPEGTVKNYLFRARQKLRQQLERKTGVLA